MRIDGYQCDVCGVHRKEANHWFMGIETEWWVAVVKWDTAKAENHKVHLCGNACAGKYVNDFLSK